MRVCVLGHSTSSGDWLNDRQLAFPWLIASELSAATDVDVEVLHVTFVPMGGRAAPYALAKVDECDPDMVIVPVASFVCSVGTVGERIRRRWGERTFRRFHRVERAFDGKTGNRPGARGGANRLARRITRRVLGTATFTSVDDTAMVYEELFRGLARREGLIVAALMEPSWPRWVDAENPGAVNAHHALRDRVKLTALQHRVVWAESDTVYDSDPERDKLYFADGVHKTEAGHRAYALALLPQLLAPDGPLGSRVKPSVPAV
jgi:hypothetical protein